MPLFSTKGQFGIGPANPQMRSPTIPRLKLNPTTPGQITIGQPPPAANPFATSGSLFGSGGGGFMTSGGEGPTGPRASAARNAETAAKRSGDQIKQWLSQLAYGQGPLSKLMIDPSKAINAAMPAITEKMTGDFNEAANRLGATGMLGFSQGKMAAGTPYQDLLGQAAKSSNLAREEIRSKYQFEADKANQDTMLALMDKLGISGGGVSGGGTDRSSGGGGGGSLESAASGGVGGDPTRDPSSIWYNDAAGYKAYLAEQKAGKMGIRTPVDDPNSPWYKDPEGYKAYQDRQKAKLNAPEGMVWNPVLGYYAPQGYMKNPWGGWMRIPPERNRPLGDPGQR